MLLLAQEGLTGKAGVKTRLECYVVLSIDSDVLSEFCPGRCVSLRDAFDHVNASSQIGNCHNLPAELLLPFSCLMSIYSFILGRHILSKTPRSRLRFYSNFSIPQIHPTTPPTPRPYTFHIGASWAGKPDDDSKKIKASFPPDTIIGTWRDKTLSRPKAVRSRDAGEDFFFVQEVLLHPYNYATL